VWIAARYIAIILCCFFVGATAGLVYILFFAPDSPLITPVPVTSEEPSGPELELKSCGIRTKKPFDNETATETDGRIDYEPTGRIYNGKLANLYEYASIYQLSMTLVALAIDSIRLLMLFKVPISCWHPYLGKIFGGKFH